MFTPAPVRLLLGLVPLLLWAAPAGAAPDENEGELRLEEARALFMAGSAAARDGRWEDAAENFRRSYELSRVPSALYNVAQALIELQRFIEARDALTQLVLEHPKLDDEVRIEATRVRRATSRRIARLVLKDLSPAGRYSILVDGLEREDSGRRPLILEVNPGKRALEIAHPGKEGFVWTGVLSEGAEQTLEVVTPSLPPKPKPPPEPEVALAPEQAPPPPPAVQPPPTEPEATAEDTSLLENPILWIVLGAVVVAGATTGTVLLLNGGDGPTPRSDRVVRL